MVGEISAHAGGMPERVGGFANDCAYTRTIITSVDLMSAAALSPRWSRISRAASAVIMEVMCWPPMESFT